MVGIKTTGEQISILCHNGTIFDKPREKNWTGHQKTRWSPRESKIDPNMVPLWQMIDICSPVVFIPTM
jgi:hypothetical protein